MNAIKLQFGIAIVADREARGASQADVAIAAGVSQQAVSGWEGGDTLPRKKRIEKLVAYFGEGSATAALAIQLGLTVASQVQRFNGTDGESGPRVLASTAPVVAMFEPSEVQSALLRAQRSVQYARQVLCDAEVQLGLALASFEIPR